MKAKRKKRKKIERKKDANALKRGRVRNLLRTKNLIVEVEIVSRQAYL